MDRFKVLTTSTSFMNLLGVSEESQAYVQKQMAAFLGIQDPNFVKEVEQLWKETYAFKKMSEKCDKEVFLQEAKVRGSKGMTDGSFEKSSGLLKELKEKQAVISKQYSDAAAKAQQAMDQYLAGRNKV